jgi:hypothetical protein
MDKTGKTLKQKAIHELEEFLYVTLYLWIFFATFVLYKAAILGERVDVVAHGFALINALVFAKFLPVVKAFHPGHQVDQKPLIYPTLVKSAIFAVVLAILKILEDVAIGYFHGKSFAGSIADLGGGSWSAVLIFAVILFVVLIPLIAFGELERVVGEGKVAALFLRPRDASKPFGQQVI